MIDDISNLFSKLGSLSPPAFVLLFLFVVNFMLRRSPVPNSWVMWISTLIGTVAYPVFVAAVTTFQFPILRNVITGFMVGAGAWACYVPVVIFAEKKWPWLSDVINGPNALPRVPETQPFTGPLPPPFDKDKK